MFIKRDESFICKNCGKQVEKLNYTSRDHCNYCLHSIHIDIEPGDRLNNCKGLLVPVNVIDTAKKGKVIIYRCNKCGFQVKNIVADDDNEEEIFNVIKKYSMQGGKI